jgi:GTP 3',8-cyclase
MPECGIDFVERKDLLSYEEMHRTLGILSGAGVTKLRITGGEPFVRKNVMDFMERIHAEKWYDETHITTNATLTAPYIDRFVSAGINTVNISLDTLDRDRFSLITRRDELPQVLDTIDVLIELNIKVKINMVVMAGVNDDDIVPMANLAKHRNIDVRFLEEMPFNGSDETKRDCYSYRDIRQKLESEFGPLSQKTGSPGETSMNFELSGFKGSLGIIASFSRTFCGTCNRLRITPTGTLKTCLYNEGGLDLREYLRNGSTDTEVLAAISNAILHKAKDGHQAENMREHIGIHESMAAIGG